MSRIVENKRFAPRRLEPGEAAMRDNIAGRFPGGARGFSLGQLANLLRVKPLRLRFTAIARDPRQDSWAGVPVAISSRSGSGNVRAVLSVDQELAHHIIDLALGRDPLRSDRELTSGEQGAFLYALDRAGGDWIAAGGNTFVVRGLLVDRDQIAEYLGGAPEWRVEGRVLGRSLQGAVRLEIRSAIVDGTAGRIRDNRGMPIDWPASLGIVVGTSRVPADDLAGLEPGDLVALDTCCHPHREMELSTLRVSCGSWQRSGRWLDSRRIEIVSEDAKGENMETQTKSDAEMVARLEHPGRGDVGSIEVVVRAEVGEVKMTVEQASALVPGRILRLDREVSAEVLLRVGDKQIGRGELVDHEGTLAVEILEVQ